MGRIEFTVNGQTHEVLPHEGESLLSTLRNRCGVLSVKDGCQPQGQCGCCLALIDGKPRVTCATLTSKCAGKDILTLEGLPEAERERVARAFVAAAGLQCGFCIPGFALRAKALLDKTPDPSRAEIAKAIDVHLCRCTGYKKIIDAVELIGAAQRGEGEPVLCDEGEVGKSLRRYRGVDLVLGDRDYVADMDREGTLHGAVTLSPHPRAKVVRIDTSKAKAVPGVVAVATYRDVPGKRWYGLIYPDWPGFIAEGEEVRCVGDFLAAVAAVDEHTARTAAALVEVEYELREPVLTPQDAIKEGERGLREHQERKDKRVQQNRTEQCFRRTQ